MLRLDKVKKYTEANLLNRIGKESIKNLENELLESYDEEICSVLSMYYEKTNNIERALFISKLMYEKESYYYDDSIIEKIILDNPSKEIITYLKQTKHPYAYEALANYYYIAEEDYNTALKYYNKLDNFKNRSCYFNKGNMYFEGEGVKPNLNTALLYFKKGYNLGCINCTCKIGQMYFEGIGLEKDPKLGYKYLKKAVTPNSETLTQYIEEIITIPENKEYANMFIELLQQSVDLGNMNDIYTISYIYETLLYDYEKAYNYYSFILENKELFSENVYKTTAYHMGLLYLEGRHVNLNIHQAKQYFEISESNSILDQIDYITGEIKDIDFVKCVEDATESFDLETDDYFRNIYNRVYQEPKVYTFNSIKDITKEKLNKMQKNSIIYLKNDVYDESVINGLYTYEDMLKIVNECNKIVKNIDLNQKEEDKFMQVYIAILSKIMPTVNSQTSEDEIDLSCFTLNSLITGDGVCSGFAKTLKELLNLVGIECNIMKSTRHQYNQVKINNKWYYCDIYWDSLLNDLDYCLKSSEDFCDEGSHMPLPVEEINESLESFPNIEDLYKRNIKPKKVKVKHKMN